ncbi:MAG: hypothetical protein V3T15_02855 [Pseudomonadales bacterium]
MRIAIGIVGVVLGLAMLWYVSQLVASESGEVVVLTTHDAAGESHDTRLWIVDHEGYQWLRAGSEMSGWFTRLKNDPAIEVERSSSNKAYTAIPRASLAPVINELMLEKYGWADRYIGFYFPRDDSIPVRLEPR